jgi:predicted enzyme related to lactoylglutathione lyase
MIDHHPMSRHVTGIGGLFFRSDDHKALAKWYYEHFGINNDEAGFIWQQDAGPTVFSPYKRDTDYFGNDKQQFMLNLRVQDIDGLLKKLEDAGVRIDPKRMDEGYGRFAWVYDPEGNKVELWEPK